MITSLFLRGFKNFDGEELRLGPFAAIVGANASGKSNIRDAFRFFHGIGRGYALADVIGGKCGAGGQVEWEPIRGAPHELSRLPRGGSDDKCHGFLLRLNLQDGDTRITYAIGLVDDENTDGGFRVIREELEAGGEKIYTSHPGDSADPVHSSSDKAHLLLRMGNGGGAGEKRGPLARVRPNQPGLTQIAEHKVKRTYKEAAERVAAALGRMRFLAPTPDRMRWPAFPGQAVLGDGGENLPAVLRNICADPARKRNLIDWIREFASMDVADFEFPVHDATEQIHLLFRDGDGRKLSAASISDGTLRFLNLLATLLEEDARGLYFFEEIDSGIHPSRLGLLLDLVETQTAKKRLQVVATTRSPDLLNMMGDAAFVNAAIICRLPDTADAIIRPVADLPGAQALRKSRGLGRLLASGWMENALAFVENRKDTA